MNKLLILTSYTKCELNSLTNNEITIKLSITDILAVATEQKSEMTSYLNNGYDVINCFAKFEKFLPHNNNTKFYVCRKSNARVRPGGFLPPPPHKK